MDNGHGTSRRFMWGPLKALASKRAARVHLHQQGLVPELLNHNLRRGTAATRSSVQVLLQKRFDLDVGPTFHLDSDLGPTFHFDSDLGPTVH